MALFTYNFLVLTHKVLSLQYGTNKNIDYRKGVKAVDKVDGEVTFTVDSSKVNITINDYSD